METEDQLRELADELRDMAGAVAADPDIPASDLRRVLRFVTKVLEVVDQSFLDVYGILIDIQFLTSDLVASGRVGQLQQDLQNVFSRSRFRDAEEICSRLHHLGETYQQSIRPVVEPLQTGQQWSQVFFLLNEHEGRIIRMIQEAVVELRTMLDSDLSGRKLSSLKRKAREKADALRDSLGRLQDLRNRILGFSGRIGFLELTETDRNELQREVKIMVDKSDHSTTNVNVVNSVVQGNLVVAKQVIDSFKADNKNPSLAGDLEKLHTTVGQLVKQLPPQDQEQVSRRLKSLTEEATSPNPDKQEVKGLGQKIIDTAGKVASMAGPVTTAVQAVLKIFGV